ncbi:hypothetical protein GCM10022277_07580 [Litoribacillus peritrichatus]|uniref:Transposase n=1 Tax=Litoribacillus peritrichatus TaxID=718191 RepID=A0ABP7M5A9_9GAMM
MLVFTGYPNNEQKKGLPVPLTHYLELVDWTGRIMREDKRGTVSNTLPLILAALVKRVAIAELITYNSTYIV